MDNNLEMSLCETTGEFKTTMSIPIRISDIKEEKKKVTSNSKKRRKEKSNFKF